MKVVGNKMIYNKSGYKLDLCYINKNVIAMSFPASGLETFYRNNIQVYLFYLLLLVSLPKRRNSDRNFCLIPKTLRFISGVLCAMQVIFFEHFKVSKNHNKNFIQYFIICTHEKGFSGILGDIKLLKTIKSRR